MYAVFKTLKKLSKPYKQRNWIITHFYSLNNANFNNKFLSLT